MGWLVGGSGASAHAGTRSLTHVKADLPAETAALSLRCASIKNVGNSLRADLCWLVGRVARIHRGAIGFRESRERRAYMQAHAKMHDNGLDL